MELNVVKGVLKTYRPGEETELVLPDNILGIGVRAFKDCTNLTSITLPEGLQEIGDYAFRGCKSLQTLRIPASVKRLGQGICRSCSALEEVSLPPELQYIPDHCFQECVTLTAVTIPENVHSIGEAAFGSCKSLTDLFLPDSVKRIGSAAFQGCKALRTVRFPEGLESLGGNVFAETRWLKAHSEPLVLAGSHLACFCSKTAREIVIPEGVHTIANGAFQNCEVLEHVTLPSTLKRIDDWAFTRCFALKEIIIPEGTETIGAHAFTACSALEAVRIPKSVQNIGYEAFNNTPWFSGQTAPFVVVGSVLLRCRIQNQPHLDLPAGIRAIGANAFEWCLSKSISVPEGVERICDSAFRASSVEEIQLPQSLQFIESAAFSECENLRSINIPDNVRHIGDFAFSYSYNLQEVSLPGKIGFIGGQAFSRGVRLVFRMPEGAIRMTLPKDWSMAAGGFFRLDSGCGKNEQALLDFLASDSIAEREIVFDEVNESTYRRMLALYMCRFYPESEIFRAYIKRTLKRLVADCIKEQDAAALSALLALEPLKAKDIDSFIEKAISSGAPELQAILLAHKNGQNLYEDPFSMFTL